MDITVNRSALLEELHLIQGVVERRTTIPILSNILLTAVGDRLQLAGTDLDVTVFASCPAVVREEGTTTIQGRVFFDMVRSLANDTVDVSSSENRVDVKSGSFSSQVASLNPDDFPTLPEIPGAQGFAIDLKALQKMIDYTSFAVSSEEGHFQYNASLLLIGEEQLQMVATDGHRLAWVAVDHQMKNPPFTQQLLPRKLLNQIRRLEQPTSSTVYISRSENHLTFRLGDHILLSRVLEARFPQYERVLVRDNPSRSIVSRADFAAAIRRVSLLASDRTHGIQLEFDNDLITMTSVGFELGHAVESLPCQYQATPVKVLVNGQFVLDFLSATDVSSISINLRDSEGAVVLSLPEVPELIKDCLYVIMPIRL